MSARSFKVGFRDRASSATFVAHVNVPAHEVGRLSDADMVALARQILNQETGERLVSLIAVPGGKS